MARFPCTVYQELLITNIIIKRNYLDPFRLIAESKLIFMKSATKKKLIKTLKQFQSLKKVESRLLELQRTIKTENSELTKVVKQMDKESDDIKKMEKMSLKSLFHKALGSKEQQLEKERQEYLQVSLKYDELTKSLEILEYEQNILEKKQDKLAGMGKVLEELIKKREEEIKTENPKAAQRIYGLMEESDEYQRVIFEMGEAIDVGMQAQKILEQIISYLNKAKNWGQWDMSGRRGRYAGHMKRSQIDRAKDLAYKAKYVLQQFEKELRDVYTQQDFQLNIQFDSFSGFTDIFFDNLITDWLIQQKIHNTLTNIHSVRDKVIRLTSTLQSEIPKMEQALDKLEAQRQKIVLDA